MLNRIIVAVSVAAILTLWLPVTEAQWDGHTYWNDRIKNEDPDWILYDAGMS